MVKRNSIRVKITICTRKNKRKNKCRRNVTRNGLCDSDQSWIAICIDLIVVDINDVNDFVKRIAVETVKDLDFVSGLGELPLGGGSWLVGILEGSLSGDFTQSLFFVHVDIVFVNDDGVTGSVR